MIYNKLEAIGQDLDIKEKPSVLVLTLDLEVKIKIKCIENLPGWQEFSHDDIIVQTITGGLSNSLFSVSVKDGVKVCSNTPLKVLMRLYGTQSADFYDPHEEIRIFEGLSKLGLGPKLYAKFSTSRIEQFLEGRNCDASAYNNPLFLAMLGGRLAQFHQTINNEEFIRNVAQLDGDVDIISYINNFNPFSRMYTWMQSADDKLLESLRDSGDKWCDHVTIEATEVIEQFKHSNWSANPQVIFDEMKILANKIVKEFIKGVDDDSISDGARIAYSKVFSHNDLHVLNVRESSEKTLTLIDFEYSQIGYAAMDFSNLIISSKFDYEKPDAPYFSYDRSKGLSTEGVKLLIVTYLCESGYCDGFPTPLLVQQFCSVVLKFQIYYLLLWGFWSIIRAPTRKEFREESFDFIAFGFFCFGLAKEIDTRRIEGRDSNIL